MDPAAMRSPALPVLVVLAIVLIGTAPGITSGDEIDVTGNWQSNQFFIPPPLETSTAEFHEIMENLSTGELTMIPGPQCGTVILDNVVSIICPPSIISGTTGKVTGSAYASPTDPNDFAINDVIFDPPIDISFGCPGGTSRILFSLRKDGTIEDDGLGTAVRISGTMLTKGVEGGGFFDSDGILCSPSGPGTTDAGSFVMLRTDTPIGPNQTVEPLDGAAVSFSNVLTEGLTTITPLSEPNGVVPPNFALLPVAIFYDVQTTATFSGSITVCLPYPDEDDDGFVDDTSPPLSETAVRILHEEGGVFVDVTASNDPNANHVCADVTDLSQFVLGSNATRDHYQCYKAKELKRVCQDDLATACSADTDCQTLCLQKFLSTNVSLTDQFGSASADVKKPKGLCAPVEKNPQGPPPEDLALHYKRYQIKGGPSVKGLRVLARDQFGDHVIELSKADSLLVPAAKDLNSPVEVPAQGVNHYLCYKAKNKKKICTDDLTTKCKTNANCTGGGTCDFGFGKVPQELTDQFANSTVEINKARFFCTPVDKNGEVIADPSNHLVGYQIKGPRINATVHTNDQFGPGALALSKQEILFVPAEKNPAP